MCYIQLTAMNQKRINDLPIHFSFGQANFEAKLAELGVTVDDIDMLPAGGWVLKKDKDLYDRVTSECLQDIENFLADDDNLVNALEYELANHEYCITYDPSDTLAALDLDLDERVKRLLTKAIENYMANVIAW